MSLTNTGRRNVAVGFVAVSLLAAGCSTTTPSPSGTNPPAQASSSLVVAVTTDPDTLVPWKATQFQAVNVLQQMYGTLTEFDKDLNVVPGLATSWDASEDGKTVTLKLREGVKFSDGSAFDAEDVKATLDMIRNPDTKAVAAASLASVDQITVKDPATVELALKNPDAALPSNLASTNLSMVPSDVNEQALATAPVGTGAFAFASRVPNQSITLRRNDNYWGDKAKAEKLEFRVIPDENAIVSALQAGNVHLSVINDPLVAKSAGDALEVVRTPQLNYHVLMLNARAGALTDVNVRLAMQCAIDRQQVLDTAALGEGEVIGPNTSPAFKSDPNARPCPTRDVEKAKEYLAKSGKTTVVVKTIVSQGEYSTSVNEAQNLKSQLADAGITLELETLESGAYVKKWIDADFEAAVALNGGRPDPDGAYGRYFPSTGNLNKVAGYSSSTLDALFAEGKASSDKAERVEIYKKIDAELEDNAVWIWLFSGYNYTATAKNVTGFQPMSNGSMTSLKTTVAGA